MLSSGANPRWPVSVLNWISKDLWGHQIDPHLAEVDWDISLRSFLEVALLRMPI